MIIETKSLDALNDRLEKSNREILESQKQEKKIEKFLFLRETIKISIVYIFGFFSAIAIMLSFAN